MNLCTQRPGRGAQPRSRGCRSLGTVGEPQALSSPAANTCFLQEGTGEYQTTAAAAGKAPNGAAVSRRERLGFGQGRQLSGRARGNISFICMCTVMIPPDRVCRVTQAGACNGRELASPPQEGCSLACLGQTSSVCVTSGSHTPTRAHTCWPLASVQRLGLGAKSGPLQMRSDPAPERRRQLREAGTTSEI